MLRFLRNLVYLAGLIGTLYFWVTLFLGTPLSYEHTFEYQVRSGATIDTIAQDFQRDAHFSQIWETYSFIAYGYLSHLAYRLKAGEYQFEPGMTPVGILQKIARGEVYYREITFPEGITFAKMLSELKENPYFKHDLKEYDDAGLHKLLGIPPTTALEGLVFPSTYKFARGSSDVKILEMAHIKLQKILDMEWEQRADTLPYQTAYQALIIASLIEREAKLKSEQPLISGVIAKRLIINMPLQIDASVIYGLGDAYTGKLTHDQVHQDTPYNTYTRTGLPPTPIAIVGQDALKAALHPVITDALFYVARGDGSHQFSATLEQQDAAVDAYLKSAKKEPQQKGQKNLNSGS